MKIIILKLIKLYQIISPFKYFSLNRCIFYPTCSEYMYQSIEKYGVIKGIGYGLKRLSKCHPFNSGGYDPVK